MPETAPTERDRTVTHGWGDVEPILVWRSTDQPPPIGLSPLAPPRRRRRGRKRGGVFWAFWAMRVWSRTSEATCSGDVWWLAFA